MKPLVILVFINCVVSAYTAYISSNRIGASLSETSRFASCITSSCGSVIIKSFCSFIIALYNSHCRLFSHVTYVEFVIGSATSTSLCNSAINAFADIPLSNTSLPPHSSYTSVMCVIFPIMHIGIS